MIKIIVNKVPKKRSYTGGAYLIQEEVTLRTGQKHTVSHELVCLACRGLSFATKAKTREYLERYVELFRNPSKRSDPGTILDTVDFKYKGRKYRIEYLFNNNFWIKWVDKTGEVEPASNQDANNIFKGLHSYYVEIPKELSKDVRAKLDIIAASTRVHYKEV